MKNPSEAFGNRTRNLTACTLNRATVHPCRTIVVVLVLVVVVVVVVIVVVIVVVVILVVVIVVVVIVVVVVRLSAETVAINEVYQTVLLIC